MGDAGCFKDPITAHGISDALRDAELLADAVVDGTDDAFAEYEARRDAFSVDFFEPTEEIASFDWDLERIKVLHHRLSQLMGREEDLIRSLDGVSRPRGGARLSELPDAGARNAGPQGPRIPAGFGLTARTSPPHSIGGDQADPGAFAGPFPRESEVWEWISTSRRPHDGGSAARRLQPRAAPTTGLASRPDCALVILSCDAYRDLWDPCLALHRRYWPDCPYPTFLVSETVPVEDPRVRPILGGAGLTWSEIALNALGTLPHRDVLFMIEDFLPDPPGVERGGGGAAPEPPRPGRRLPAARAPAAPEPPGDRPSGIGVHERGSRFRASLQAAFWDRRTLLDLLRPDESIWDFERDGLRAQRRPRGSLLRDVVARRYDTSTPWSPAAGLPSDGGCVAGRRWPSTVARPDVTLRWRLAAPMRLARMAAGGPVAWRVRKALGLRPAPG